MNPRVRSPFPVSLIRQVAARKRPGSIDLGLGEPTLLPTRAHFDYAMRHVVERGVKYAPNAGDPYLREAIARHYAISRYGRGRERLRDRRLARSDVRDADDAARRGQRRAAGRRAGLSVVRQDGRARRRRLPHRDDARRRRLRLRCRTHSCGRDAVDARDRSVFAVQSDRPRAVARSGRTYSQARSKGAAGNPCG